MQAKLWAASLLIAVGLAGLSPAAAQDDSTTEASQPVVPIAFTRGDVLLRENFDQENAWDNYSDDTGVNFAVDHGEYRMHMPVEQADNFVWGLNSTEHTDVIIEAKFAQETDSDDAAFGLMCRADTDNEGYGYYFIIRSDGFGYIAKSTPTDETVTRISNLSDSVSIRQGSEANLVKAICVGDYLALYVNDKLIAEANDEDFTSGYAGLIASSGKDKDTDVLVDELSITEAIPGQTEFPTLPEFQQYSTGDIIETASFDTDDNWPPYDGSTGAHLGVSEGAYHFTAPGGVEDALLVRGAAPDNMILSVRASLISGSLDNTFGVMCRLGTDERWPGYNLLINGNGKFAIERATLKGDKDVNLSYLADWTESPAINQGYASNDLTIVCADNYLAFYANGVLLAEAHDSRFSAGDYALNVILSGGDATDISFDDLTVYQAQS